MQQVAKISRFPAGHSIEFQLLATKFRHCHRMRIALYLQCFDAVGWAAGRASRIRPVKTERWGAGVVICLERCADLHMAQLMPLPLTVSCVSKIQIRFTFLVPAHPGSPGKRAVKRVCVCRIRFAWVCKRFTRQLTSKRAHASSAPSEKQSSSSTGRVQYSHSKCYRLHANIYSQNCPQVSSIRTQLSSCGSPYPFCDFCYIFVTVMDV